jgi:hypothetical protein
MDSMMNNQKLNVGDVELANDPMNPRTMDRADFKALLASMKEFGDLSPIVRNVQTGHLVGGHRRKDTIIQRQKEGAQITYEYTHKFDEPDNQGTIGLGYIIVDGQRYSYREVDWDINIQRSANVAANEIQGRFDDTMKAQVLYELGKVDKHLVEMTGAPQKELDRLMKIIGQGPDDEEDTSASAQVDNKFMIIIEADNESQQQSIFDQLSSQGIKCRLG